MALSPDDKVKRAFDLFASEDGTIDMSQLREVSKHSKQTSKFLASFDSHGGQNT